MSENLNLLTSSISCLPLTTTTSVSTFRSTLTIRRYRLYCQYPTMTRLPQEIYEHIIDALSTPLLEGNGYHNRPPAFLPETLDLLSYTLVSPSWLPRCRYHLAHIQFLCHPHHLRVAVEAFRKYPDPTLLSSSQIYVRGAHGGSGFLLSPTWVNCFPIQIIPSMSRRFTELCLEDVDMNDAHPTFLPALSTFRSLTRLSFVKIDCRTPSFVIRLVRSLPSLTHLSLCKVKCLKSLTVPLGDHPHRCFSLKKVRLRYIHFQSHDPISYSHIATLLATTLNLSNLNTLILKNRIWGATESCALATHLLFSKVSLGTVRFYFGVSCLPNIYDYINLRHHAHLQSVKIDVEGSIPVVKYHVMCLPRFISSSTSSLSTVWLRFRVTEPLNIGKLPWTPIGKAFDQSSHLEQTKIILWVNKWGIDHQSTILKRSQDQELILSLFPVRVRERVQFWGSGEW